MARGLALAGALAALAPRGSVVVDDALTSTAIADVGSAGTPIGAVTIQAADQGRAVIRTAPGTEWVLHRQRDRQLDASARKGCWSAAPTSSCAGSSPR